MSLAGAGRVSLFAAGFAVSSLLLVALALLALSETGAVGEGGAVFYGLLAVNAVLIAALAGTAVARAARKLMGRRFGEPAPRLHIRFIALFALAAVAPAALMAAFHALVLGRGVEFWFGERVNTLVETTAAMAREQAPLTLSLAELQLLGMVNDLSQPQAIRGLQENRIRYAEYLRSQAIGRGFAAAYVIDERATILARAEAPGAPAFAAPSLRLFDLAHEDIGVSDPVQREDEPDYVRMLIDLPNYDGAYLYVVWYADFSLLTAAEQATMSYRQAVAREGQMREVFILVYAEASALILVGAIWLALTAANRVVTPVGRLVSAAERVRRGDLDARVDVPRDDDEIAALGRAFNRMTRQLNSQRSALLDANAEAERRRAFIEAVLTGVSAGVIGVDEAGRITLVNRSAASLLDIDPDSLVGEHLEQAAPVFLPVVEEATRRPAEIAERQIDLAGSDGALTHLNVRAGRDENGGLVITFDDVTRLVSAQRNAAWRDVARRIAHEIKNPLTPIQLSAERLRRKYRKQLAEDDLDTFDRCVETIVRQVSDIGRMVDEFSSFARMPAPKMEAADLGDIAQGAVFAQRVASPQLRVNLDRDDGPHTVECDSRLASQALANILKNAAESVSARMEGEGAKSGGRIDVEVRSEEGFGIIEVRDDGLGWPTPDRSRLTEPYMTTREKGTGLGLAIVRRVMEDHGGRLELDDPPGDGPGAIVRLAFPLLDLAGGRSDPAARAEA
ncbi:PAS domain-containing sensor histidine kinase [Marinicauda salina]|uniref:histidine kinase n=1 Tax=Marinicauda salina TaxID=2135793 RepID=A0A2U2BV21_9PROT|nr:PAS domain-containing sensor histidine kinase [Marinicauda salina]